MGKIIKKRIEYGGSSNSAENIKYDDTKNVKEAIDGVKSDIADVNSNLSTNFPTAWNYPILSSCMINEFDYTYGNEVAQRDAILKLSTNTHESFTYLGLRTALINYSNGKEMILYSGNGDRYGGGIILSNISQKFFKAEKDDITFFDIDSINSNLIILEASTQVDMTANRELDDTTGAITIPSGYKPIAMYAYNSNNNDNVSALPLLIRSNGRILYHAKNHSASDQGVIEFVIRVTFKRM